MLALLSFTFSKTAASIDLLTAYETISQVVTHANPLIQGLDLGVNDRHDAQTLGRQLIQARDDAKSRAMAYFTLRHPLHSNQAQISTIHRLILAGFSIDNNTGTRLDINWVRAKFNLV